MSKPAKQQLQSKNFGTKLSANDLLSLREYSASIPLASEFEWRSQPSVYSTSDGAIHAENKGRGVQYDESRLYQPGDDVSRMDWRVTARTGKAHVKLFREETQKSIFFVIDQGPSMQFGTRRVFKSVQAAQAAILSAWVASKHEYKVGGVVLHFDLCSLSPLMFQRKGVERLFETLLKESEAITKNSAPFDGNIGTIVPQLSNQLHQGASLVIVSDFYTLNSEVVTSLGYLSSLYEVTVVFVFDPLEKDIPEGEVITIKQGDLQAQLDGRSPKFRQSYQAQFLDHQRQLEACCLDHGIRFIALSTEQHPGDIFSSHFQYNVS